MIQIQGQSQARTPGQVREQMQARPGFASRTAKCLGITQLTCGILAILLGVGAIFTPTMNGFSWSYIGSAIWCGAMFIIPGAFGVHSARSKSNCAIITTMVMSILAAAVFVPFMLGFTAADLARATRGWCWNSIDYGYYHCPKPAATALNSILVSIVVVEFVAAIWHSAVCCRAVCKCCKPHDPDAVRTNVQYVQAGQQVILMTPTGPQQAFATTTNTGQTAYVLQQVPGTVIQLPPGQVMTTGQFGAPMVMQYPGQNPPPVNPQYPTQGQGPPQYTSQGQGQGAHLYTGQGQGQAQGAHLYTGLQPKPADQPPDYVQLTSADQQAQGGNTDGNALPQKA